MSYTTATSRYKRPATSYSGSNIIPLKDYASKYATNSNPPLHSGGTINSTFVHRYDECQQPGYSGYMRSTINSEFSQLKHSPPSDLPSLDRHADKAGKFSRRFPPLSGTWNDLKKARERESAFPQKLEPHSDQKSLVSSTHSKYQSSRDNYRDEKYPRKKEKSDLKDREKNHKHGHYKLTEAKSPDQRRVRDGIEEVEQQQRKRELELAKEVELRRKAEEELEKKRREEQQLRLKLETQELELVALRKKEELRLLKDIESRRIAEERRIRELQLRHQESVTSSYARPSTDKRTGKMYSKHGYERSSSPYHRRSPSPKTKHRRQDQTRLEQRILEVQQQEQELRQREENLRHQILELKRSSFRDDCQNHRSPPRFYRPYPRR